MGEYKYTPLPNGEHFRILRVERPYLGRGEDIRCSMEAAPLNSGVEYAALSYSWGMDQDGDASICEHIIVDGQTFGVTKNLLHGLRRLFIPTEYDDDFYPIWIDAICIDQSNVEERNAQVAKMAEIYSCASKVFVWLGEDNNPGDSDGIAAVLDCLARPTHQHYSEHVVATPQGNSARLCLAHAGIASATALNSLLTSGTKLPPVDFPTCLPPQIQKLFDPEQLSIAINEMQRLLMVFLNKRYWCRRWVIQELYHADHNEVYILYAGQVTGVRPLRNVFGRIFARLGWADVERVLNLKLSLNDSDQNLRVAIDKVTNMLGLQNSIAMFGKKHALASSMHISNGYDCSDPRDRLYALLSIDHTTRIRPDYGLKPHEVYAAFSADLVRTEGLLADLIFAAASQKTQNFDDATSALLPSWCLDLRENFADLRNDVTLGPCEVVRHQLRCTILAVGRYTSKGQDIDPVIGARNESLQGRRSCRIQYTYSNKCSLGDLLCIFRHIEDSPSPMTMPAVILKPIDEKLRGYQIIGLCILQWSSWKPEDHIHQDVTIF